MDTASPKINQNPVPAQANRIALTGPLPEPLGSFAPLAPTSLHGCNPRPRRNRAAIPKINHPYVPFPSDIKLTADSGA
jgi:hypothetical protein